MVVAAASRPPAAAGAGGLIRRHAAGPRRAGGRSPGARAALACVAALGVALVALPAPARAHGEGNSDIRTVIERTSPKLPGISVRTVTSTATALELVNRTGRDVEILSDRRVPFLRIGPRGVEANVNEKAFYASGNPDGFFELPPEARIGAPPRWARISKTPGWTWFERRMQPTGIVIPAKLREGRVRRRLGDWKVPLLVGGRPASIDGYVEYQPRLGQVVPSLRSSRTPAPGVVAAILPGPVPGIFLDATSTRERVNVLGAAGEPYLRFGPGGVEANLRSPTHQADLLVRGGRPTVPADTRAKPRWREVAEDARYTWLDSRARYPREQPPDPVVDAGRRQTLLEWRVPLEVGGDSAELRGATSWVPIATRPEVPAPAGRTAAPGPWIGALAVLTALALGGAAYVGRRRPTVAR